MNPKALMSTLFCLILLFLCTGCEAYKIQGTVVAGTQARVDIVDKDDERLKVNGIPDATVSAVIDPDAMRPTFLEPVTTDDAGRFAIPMDSLGAGFLEYKVVISAQANGSQPAEKTLKVPGSGKRLLITLPAGRGNLYQRPTDVLKETLEMKNQLMR